MGGAGTDGASDPRPPARPSRVLGIAGALVVLLVTLAAIVGIPRELASRVTILQRPAEPVAVDAAVRPHFAPSDLPFDFRLANAHRLATGEVVVRIENDDPRADEEDDGDGTQATPEDANSKGQDEGDRPPDPEEFTVERRERHAREDGTPPTEVWLARYPRAAAEGALARHFRRRSDDGERPRLDETITIEGGRLRWGRFDADFVHERDYDGDGHFRDALRVNLTRGTRCWILFAAWPRDYRGSRAPIAALLEGLPPGDG